MQVSSSGREATASSLPSASSPGFAMQPPASSLTRNNYAEDASATAEKEAARAAEERGIAAAKVAALKAKAAAEIAEAKEKARAEAEAKARAETAVEAETAAAKFNAFEARIHLYKPNL